MPTNCRQFGETEQAAERLRACTHPSTVWACEAPCGWFNLLREDGKYRLTGAGLRLFGQSDNFGPDIDILGVDDADAVGSAKRLILARWRLEMGLMESAFGVQRVPDDRGPGLFDQTAEPGPCGVPGCDCPPITAACGWEADERVPPCGKADCERCVRHGTVTDPDGTADLDDPGGGPVG